MILTALFVIIDTIALDNVYGLLSRYLNSRKQAKSDQGIIDSIIFNALH